MGPKTRSVTQGNLNYSDSDSSGGAPATTVPGKTSSPYKFGKTRADSLATQAKKVQTTAHIPPSTASFATVPSSTSSSATASCVPPSATSAALAVGPPIAGLPTAPKPRVTEIVFTTTTCPLILAHNAQVEENMRNAAEARKRSAELVQKQAEMARKSSVQHRVSQSMPVPLRSSTSSSSSSPSSFANSSSTPRGSLSRESIGATSAVTAAAALGVANTTAPNKRPAMHEIVANRDAVAKSFASRQSAASRELVTSHDRAHVKPTQSTSSFSQAPGKLVANKQSAAKQVGGKQAKGRPSDASGASKRPIDLCNDEGQCRDVPSPANKRRVLSEDEEEHDSEEHDSEEHDSEEHDSKGHDSDEEEQEEKQEEEEEEEEQEETADHHAQQEQQDEQDKQQEEQQEEKQEQQQQTAKQRAEGAKPPIDAMQFLDMFAKPMDQALHESGVKAMLQLFLRCTEGEDVFCSLDMLPLPRDRLHPGSAILLPLVKLTCDSMKRFPLSEVIQEQGIRLLSFAYRICDMNGQVVLHELALGTVFSILCKGDAHHKKNDPHDAIVVFVMLVMYLTIHQRQDYYPASLALANTHLLDITMTNSTEFFRALIRVLKIRSKILRCALSRTWHDFALCALSHLAQAGHCLLADKAYITFIYESMSCEPYKSIRVRYGLRLLKAMLSRALVLFFDTEEMMKGTRKLIDAFSKDAEIQRVGADVMDMFNKFKDN